MARRGSKGRHRKNNNNNNNNNHHNVYGAVIMTKAIVHLMNAD